MSEPTSNATVPVPLPPPTWESRLPSWQQWLNSFCENWIFAFIIAMTIRHFCVEAFRIPTASMEPMLYGDPAFSKSDHVVVDKFLFRFTGPSRWDVTVFQFPQPEIEPRPGEGEARTAITADADQPRLDTVMLRPLMYRNFVKRAVILPGDTYYIANGNIYLKQADGHFQVSRKPDSVQQELWQEVYRFGVQPDYQPWLAEGSSAATIVDGALRLSVAPNSDLSLFPQQFRNLYLKPGSFRVRPINGGADELITLSMTSPQFTYRSTNTSGVAWDLEKWHVRRMNSNDLDHYDHGDKDAGTLLNDTMDEFVGDVRFRAQIRELTGTVALDLTQGKEHAFRVEFTAAGWTFVVDGKAVATGKESPVGANLTFGILDDRVFLSVNDKELAHYDALPNNPSLNRLGARWSGNGAVSLSRLAMDRDVHYTVGNKGSFLRNEAIHFSQMKRQADAYVNDPSAKAFDRDMSAKSVRDMIGVRAQMLGKTPEELTGDDRFLDMGNSPLTALTAPPGAYLLMGDNSPQSWDSRCWGYVASENLRGRVLAVVLPFSRWRVVR